MTRFVRNRAFEREMKADPELIAQTERTTEEAAGEVRHAAPDVTGHYRRQVKAEGDRVFVDPHFWHLIEFGSANNHPYAPVQRGIRAVGLRLDMSRL